MEEQSRVCIPTEELSIENCRSLANPQTTYPQIHVIAVRDVVNSSGVTNFRFHDLCHTFASLLVQADVDLYKVQRLLGHKDGRMTQRYAHLTRERLASAVSRLDDVSHSLDIVHAKEKGVALATP